MKFQSEVKISSPSKKIQYTDKLLFLGSCFSGNIGNKFNERLFNSLVNPFGVIFNPISIFKLINRAINKSYFDKSNWIFRNDKWLNLDLHGELSNTDLHEAIKISNSIIDNVGDFLKSADQLFLTFGTAWVYNIKNTNQLVANCHKIPQKEFDKRMLSISEVVDYGNELIANLKSFNPKLQITFTVSPVRHWADGAHNNNLSKSTLHLAINSLLENENTEYFPSYELVIDQLRDYRFFDRDLVHPNDVATDFVWEKLLSDWIDDKTIIKIHEVEKIISSANHRPFDVRSDAHQKFLNKTISNLESLSKQLPEIDFSSILFKLNRDLRKI